MAKGRKQGSSTRHEDQLLGSFGYGGSGGGGGGPPGQGGHGHGNGTTDISELVEEDVWSMVDDMDNMDLADHHRDDDSHSNSRHPSPPMAITGNRWRSHGSRNRRRSGGLSMAFVEDSAGNGKAQASRIVHQFRGGGQDNVATSAPVNVPDWPKILRVDSVESMHDSDDCGFENGDLAEWVPPHEYLAREYARTRRMTATSVLEGVGRTLKGRDLSRVRDAVWSQTGFDG